MILFVYVEDYQYIRGYRSRSHSVHFVVPSDAALALPIPPKVRSHDAAHTLARSHFFLKNTASPDEYANHSSLS